MKRIIYILLVVAAILIVWKIYDKYAPTINSESKEANYQVFNDLFGDLGITDSECIIDGYYYYGDEYVSEDKAHEIIENLAREIGVTSDYKYIRNESSNGEEESYENLGLDDTKIYSSVLKTDGDRFNFSISFVTVCKKKSDNISNYKQYIGINIIVKDSIESGYYYRRIVDEKIGELISENQDVSMVIKGKIKGNISIDEQKKISDSIFEAIGAKVVYENGGSDSGNGYESYNIYGYTKEIKESMKLAGEKININIAFNYNESDNVTFIHVGMPIVNYEY